jgi:hypothetical protein
MTKQNFKQRSIKGIAIAICLAATTMFSGCDKDDPMNNGADIVAFTFNGINGTAVIDKDALTVTATANETVDLTSIVATFTLSNGATATVNGTAQVSGQTANNFSNTVIYNVTSSDSRLTNIWKVTITGGTFKYFGVKQGKVEYTFTTYNGYETTTETHTLIFDDYGKRLRSEVRRRNGDELRCQVHIIDMITEKQYRYFEDEYPNYDEEYAYSGDWLHFGYHCWKANDYQWGLRRENLQILANQTIAEKSCSVFSFDEDGDHYEYAEWNNITFRRYERVMSWEYELKATSFSTSIPNNSFMPFGGE